MHAGLLTWTANYSSIFKMLTVMISNPKMRALFQEFLITMALQDTQKNCT